MVAFYFLFKVVTEFRIQTGTSANTAVKAIEFARRGSAFLINSQDRIIRVFDSQIVLSCQGTEGAEPEPIQKLQDLVNRTLWKKCCFSGDGEYICAGSSRTHALYIWEKGVGNLVKILHGTKGELLLDVVITHNCCQEVCNVESKHYVALVAGFEVASNTANNCINFKWSCFNLGSKSCYFKELDENVEYEEKENEFDIEDEDEEAEVPSETEAGEEDEVDVCTVERIPALCSSDEENDEDPDSIYYLPVAPEIDDPEETGWTQEFSQNDVHPTGVERKRSATQESSSESQKKKIKVIDIRNGSSEQESKSHGINKSSPQSKPFQSEETSARNLESVSGVAKTNELDKQANTDIDSIFE
ncbi:Retinoblastoma-binding protein 5-like protein [Acropora cervicornis]|uniref:Retinoblastoma-binding protein 5-like protein n=1 Tax=Acropora cervicornis TaxID=6130 RepID=A0AAD9R5P2_ACRCE|nr:Retinoblastoma-binding protein 5-like protein [Acropora cervicornis]